MASLGLRITELAEETTQTDADLLEIVHAGANKKITRANLLSTAAEIKTKIAAQVAAAADKIPIRNASGQVEGDITGNAVTATSAASATNAADAAVAAAVTLADEAADATCFPVFAPNATGDQALKTDTAYTYDPTTGVLGVQGINLGDGVVANLLSGEYTPTFTFGSASMSASNPLAFYFRIGAYVLVHGHVTLVSSAGAGTVSNTVDISLPIASDFAAAANLFGHAVRDSAGTYENLRADTTNNRAETVGAALASVEGAGLHYTFNFMYKVI